MRNIRMLTLSVLGSVGLFLTAGCAADRNKDVPASAKIVAQGQKDVAYRAPDDGTIYVFDKSEQKVIYSGRVDRDELLKVEAMRDRITLDGKVVMDKQIRDHDAINIFFEPEPYRPAVIEAGDRTVIREREVRTVPQSETTVVTPRSDSTITVRPEGENVTIQGGTGSKVTVEQPNSDSKVTIEQK